MTGYDLEFALHLQRPSRTPSLGLFAVLTVLAVAIGVVLGFAT